MNAKRVRLVRLQELAGWSIDLLCSYVLFLLPQDGYRRFGPIPILRFIPFDIHCAVIKSLDFDTLKIISLVGPEYKHEADKILWRNMHLHFSSDESSKAQLASKLMIVETRAAYLRELKITVPSSLGSDDDPAVVEATAVISRTLQLAVKLQTLRMLTLFHHAPFSQMLAGEVVLPNLSSLYTTIPLDQTLVSFLTSLPKLSFIRFVQFQKSHCDFEFHQPLRALEELEIGTASEAQIIRGSPVKSLTVGRLDETECAALWSDIAASTAPLSRLHLTLSPIHPPTATLYREILQNLPHLRFLRIEHPRIKDDHERSVAIRIIGSLNCLEELEWHGADTSSQADVFKACNEGLESLRKVSFWWYSSPLKHFSCTYSRKTRESDWFLRSAQGSY